MGFTAYRKAAALLLAACLLGRGFALSAAAEGQTLADPGGDGQRRRRHGGYAAYYSQVKGGYTVRPPACAPPPRGGLYRLGRGEARHKRNGRCLYR